MTKHHDLNGCNNEVIYNNNTLQWNSTIQIIFDVIITKRLFLWTGTLGRQFCVFVSISRQIFWRHVLFSLNNVL